MKKFLATFAGIAAAFAANASVPQTTALTLNQSTDGQKETSAQATLLGKKFSTFDVKGDQFDFVLRKSPETGSMMAYHSSHASHASHRSHYSSR